ncbi:hypothetical protein I6G56_20980 [Burkholderia humptydooensis]|uniref:Uncharacterized protein n=3 Tax=Burkholderia TaxID=32008 RepID=A0A7U4P9H9_9BURK|nr:MULTISPECIES: hypothetical protein [Burkholderia]AJY40243.1 hypothetical protein BW21_5889 [Burkholderia sp. 2002721687]ALX45484.1 hypothetical protein AQ610_23760 [Burkholderia humptydooensis]EIP85314.1 hypothetical protein A33K_17868 [Burkholderia humptydooensis MSMB43]QPS46956.1 hypothetical protein I6G56_20980 [Burkholderia humptydooensis]
MRNAVNLSLLIGPVPAPAPQDVLQALVQARVEDGSGDAQSGFELTFELPARSPLRTLFLLTGGGSLPLMRVVLVVTINGRAQSIIDGVTTNVETQPGEGGVGKLVVKGKDLSALMDVIELPGIPFPAMPPSARVLLCLAKYAALGVIPIVIPSILDIPPLPIQKIPQQRGSDYAYVKRLAGEAGYVFYLEPGPGPGTSKAYWGPEIRVGDPQPALTTGMDAQTNVESLSFTFDKERKSMPIVFFQESTTKVPIPVPIPDVTPLAPPLGLVPPLPPKIEKLDATAHLSAPEALMAGLAYASRNSDSVFGTGKLDVAKYGRLLKSRSLVGVRGAGVPFDGLYYVKRVTHEIERGSYKQSFSLARNGLVSTFPSVPT